MNFIDLLFGLNTKSSSKNLDINADTLLSINNKSAKNHSSFEKILENLLFGDNKNVKNLNDFKKFESLLIEKNEKIKDINNLKKLEYLFFKKSEKIKNINDFSNLFKENFKNEDLKNKFTNSKNFYEKIFNKNIFDKNSKVAPKTAFNENIMEPENIKPNVLKGKNDIKNPFYKNESLNEKNILFQELKEDNQKKVEIENVKKGIKDLLNGKNSNFKDVKNKRAENKDAVQFKKSIENSVKEDFNKRIFKEIENGSVLTKKESKKILVNKELLKKESFDYIVEKKDSKKTIFSKGAASLTFFKDKKDNINVNKNSEKGNNLILENEKKTVLNSTDTGQKIEFTKEKIKRKGDFKNIEKKEKLNLYGDRNANTVFTGFEGFKISELNNKIDNKDKRDFLTKEDFKSLDKKIDKKVIKNEEVLSKKVRKTDISNTPVEREKETLAKDKSFDDVKKSDDYRYNLSLYTNYIDKNKKNRLTKKRAETSEKQTIKKIDIVNVSKKDDLLKKSDFQKNIENKMITEENMENLQNGKTVLVKNSENLIKKDSNSIESGKFVQSEIKENINIENLADDFNSNKEEKQSNNEFLQKNDRFYKNVSPKNSISFKINDILVNAVIKNQQLNLNLSSLGPVFMINGLEGEIRTILKESGFKGYNVTIKDREKKVYINSKNLEKSYKRDQSKINVMA